MIWFFTQVTFTFLHESAKSPSMLTAPHNVHFTFMPSCSRWAIPTDKSTDPHSSIYDPSWTWVTCQNNSINNLIYIQSDRSSSGKCVHVMHEHLTQVLTLRSYSVVIFYWPLYKQKSVKNISRMQPITQTDLPSYLTFQHRMLTTTFLAFRSETGCLVPCDRSKFTGTYLHHYHHHVVTQG